MLKEYLKRIGITDKIEPKVQDLIKIHQSHVLSVPFEDLDIHKKVSLKLNLKALQNKIITDRRGGFCYELNYLFSHLLSELGFQTRIVSARIFDDQKILGPEYDHMALIIEFKDSIWLADVGFGDLFIRPLKIHEVNIQKDVLYSFRIEPLDGGRYCLSMAKDGENFDNKYIFDLLPQEVSKFKHQCEIKQTSPQSYFVKNKICTLPTMVGRRTLFNDKFIEKISGIRKEQIIENEKQERVLLSKFFGIEY